MQTRDAPIWRDEHRLLVMVELAQQRRRYHVKKLVLMVDDMKLLLQIGEEIHAFVSFAQFQMLSELTVGLGNQSGGWRWRLTARPEAVSHRG